MKIAIYSRIKTLICTSIILLTSFISSVNAQLLQIGHRNDSTAILDLGAAFVSSVISPTLTGNGYNLESIHSFEIDDKISDTNYNANLTIGIIIHNDSNISIASSYYLVLKYITNENSYTLDTTGGDLGIANGGKIACTAENCVGCLPYKASGGSLAGCTQCTAKVDPESPLGPTCKTELGDSPWIPVLSSVLVALIDALI